MLRPDSRLIYVKILFRAGSREAVISNAGSYFLAEEVRSENSFPTTGESGLIGDDLGQSSARRLFMPSD